MTNSSCCLYFFIYIHQASLSTLGTGCDQLMFLQRKLTLNLNILRRRRVSDFSKPLSRLVTLDSSRKLKNKKQQPPKRPQFHIYIDHFAFGTDQVNWTKCPCMQNAVVNPILHMWGVETHEPGKPLERVETVQIGIGNRRLMKRLAAVSV